ncbi:hypothetical protein [Mucilaginibacter sp.]|uniref:hypothetical protein n=1 Tax=Mucilaginibacter sp. TaxID=1882438 RepID=UPI0026313AFC|nr:hypothetical protein [Mucilaginibacter sp.]MDB5031277.1 hypothetical protein [Mucilaginibacter sp.]
MKRIFLFVVLGFITTVGYAQSDSLKRLSTGMIQYSPASFFRSGKFTVDGKQITVKEVNARLANYQPDADEYNKYKKYRNLTYYTCGSALGFLAASLIATGNSNTFKNTSSKIFAGIGIGLLVPEAIFASKRNKHFARAGYIYNQQFR